jgi:hypothetical protein
MLTSLAERPTVRIIYPNYRVKSEQTIAQHCGSDQVASVPHIIAEVGAIRSPVLYVRIVRKAQPKAIYAIPGWRDSHLEGAKIPSGIRILPNARY